MARSNYTHAREDIETEWEEVGAEDITEAEQVTEVEQAVKPIAMVKCGCKKGSCQTRHCVCFKAELLCSDSCHKGREACLNIS